MDLNRKIVTAIQQALPPEQAASRPDRSWDYMARKVERKDATNLLSSIIAQDKIASKFVSMDDSTDRAAQKPSNNSSSTPANEGAHRRKYEGKAQGERLKDIVSDDAKWNFFVQSVYLKDPRCEDAQSMRAGLIKGLERGDWGQAEDDPLFDGPPRKPTRHLKNAQALDGVGERIDLWLHHSDFFEQLFAAIRDGDLSNRPNLITDSLLIDFVVSLPDDDV